MPSIMFRGGARGEYFTYNVGTGALHSPGGSERWASTPKGVQALMNHGPDWRPTAADVVPASAPRLPLAGLAPKDLPPGRYALNLIAEGTDNSHVSVFIAVENGKAVLEKDNALGRPVPIALDFAMPSEGVAKAGFYLTWAGLKPRRLLTIGGQMQVADHRPQFFVTAQVGSQVRSWEGVWDPRAL